MPVLAGDPVLDDLHPVGFHIVYVLTGRARKHDAPLRDYSFALGLQGGPDGQGAAVSLFLFPILLAVVFVHCARAQGGAYE